ncbi:MAG: hypothetical protein EZS28_031219, partial [Streblomastix strix]
MTQADVLITGYYLGGEGDIVDGLDGNGTDIGYYNGVSYKNCDYRFYYEVEQGQIVLYIGYGALLTTIVPSFLLFGSEDMAL